MSQDVRRSGQLCRLARSTVHCEVLRIRCIRLTFGEAPGDNSDGALQLTTDAFSGTEESRIVHVGFRMHLVVRLNWIWVWWELEPEDEGERSSGVRGDRHFPLDVVRATAEVAKRSENPIDELQACFY